MEWATLLNTYTTHQWMHHFNNPSRNLCCIESLDSKRLTWWTHSPTMLNGFMKSCTGCIFLTIQILNILLSVTGWYRFLPTPIPFNWQKWNCKVFSSVKFYKWKHCLNTFFSCVEIKSPTITKSQSANFLFQLISALGNKRWRDAPFFASKCGGTERFLEHSFFSCCFI